MKLTRTIFAVFLGALILALPQKTGWPCGGTPRPSCGRSIWMALLAPKNVAFRAGVPIQVPIGVMPYLIWNPNPPCAQPTANSSGPGLLTQGNFFTNANLTLNATCTPFGGAPVTLGPFTWTLPPPTAPGLQSPNAVSFDIPAGTFDGSVPVVCEVSGTYTVDFGAGPGSGTLSASNQVTAYVVPASPQDDTKPRLDMVYFATGEQDTLFKKCRRGDQAYFYFLITNNDLRNSANLNVVTTLNPRSGLPDSFDPAQASQNYQAQVFSLQDPTGDFYAHGFVDNPATWQTLPEGDPHNNPAGLNNTLRLKAGEAGFIVVRVRSFGMCGNGSCNKLTVQLQGTFTDDKPALACASTALLVEDVPGKSRRWEIRDVIKTGPNSGAVWTPSLFFDQQLQPIPHSQLHYMGNANPMVQRQTVMSSNESREDYIRIDPSVTPRAVTYNASFSSQVGFGINLVGIVGLPEEAGASKAIPAIFRQGISQLRIAINCEIDSIKIYVGEQLLHAGNYSEFLESPPADFRIDATVCRIFTKTASPNVPEICSDLYYFAKRYEDGMDTRGETIRVFDQAGNPASGTVAVMGEAANYVTLAPSFSGQFTFKVAPDLPNNMPITGAFSISSPGAVNSPLQIPVVFTEVKPSVAVEERREAILPKEFALYENYPNPFNPETTIPYALPKASNVRLMIFNVQGQLVRTLVDMQQPAGFRRVKWDGRSDAGEPVAGGVYLFRMEAGDPSTSSGQRFVQTRKLLLVK